MADNVTFQSTTPATPPAGTKVSADDASDSSGLVQRVKLCYSADGSSTHVDAGAGGLLVDLGSNNDVTIASGTITTVSTVTTITNPVAVTDNGSTLSIDDGGGTITVDGTVAATQSGSWSVNQGGPWSVSVSGSVAAVCANAGTFAVQVDGSALTSLQLIDDPVATTGSAIPAKGFAVSGTDGTDARVLKTDSSGELQVDVLTQPARAATTDTITAKIATDAVMNGTTALTPKYAVISASSSGNNTVISAVASKKVRVLRFHLSSNGSVNAKFTDGAGGSDLTGLHYLTQYGGIGAAYCPVGLFEGSTNTALVLNLSGAIAVGGVLTYVEV